MRVCIIGDSLSSLTLAKALVNLNINVNVLYKKKDIKLNKSRTIGISKTNIDFFNKHIVNIEKILWKLKKIEIYSKNLKEEKLLNFENNNNQLFSILKNYELYKLLENDLKKNKLFKKKLFTNKNLSFVYDYDFIINCDYFNNITKKYFNKKIVKKYNSFAYTTIIKHENTLNDTAVQIFTSKGPLAFLPTSNLISLTKKYEVIGRTTITKIEMKIHISLHPINVNKKTIKTGKINSAKDKPNQPILKALPLLFSKKREIVVVAVWLDRP